MMNLTKILIAVASFFFLMVGLDKFLSFLEPPCSLENHISPMVWRGLGVLQFASGILIWLPRIRKQVAGFWVVFMLIFTIMHLTQQTYDIGGSTFMAILLAVIVWKEGKAQL